MCLPFAIADINDSPLAGATVKTLSSTSYEAGTKTLTLNFNEENLTSLEAGKPYLVKWESGGNIEDPMFQGVTISDTANAVSTQYVDFVGTYSPVTLLADDKSKLFLSTDNTVYYPSVDKTVNAFRAYFELKGLTAGDLPSADVRVFVLNFDDKAPTGIRSIDNVGKESGAWYDLQGSRLVGKPATKGIYINNGNKIVVK